VAWTDSPEQSSGVSPETAFLSIQMNGSINHSKQASYPTTRVVLILSLLVIILLASRLPEREIRSASTKRSAGLCPNIGPRRSCIREPAV